MSVNCPICSGQSSFFVSKKDRFGQEYTYVKCQTCGFLFDQELVNSNKNLETKTSKVYDKDYFNTIDSGWQLRGDKMLKIINSLLKILKIIKYPTRVKVLDYGAGNGYITSKINHTADIYYYDKYEKPTYKGSYKVLEHPERADVLCAVELVEHLSDMKEWDALSKLSKHVMIITTEVSDGIDDKNLREWVYVNPDAGHTCIYSFDSLFILAKQYGFFYFFFPYKLSHIFIRSKFLSNFNFVAIEYSLYIFIKNLKRLIKK